MALIKCNECGKEISDKADKCPNCGCPIKHSYTVNKQPYTITINNTTVNVDSIWENHSNKNDFINHIKKTYKLNDKDCLDIYNKYINYRGIRHTNNVGEKKKDSTLSIWAIVLSLFGCTAPIAFILALVDLCMNNKSKRHIGSWFALIVCGLLFLIFAFGYGGSTLTSGSKEKQLDILLCEDENVRVYLDHIKNGQIYIRYCNDSDENINISYKDLTINGDRYYSSIWVEEVYSHDEDVVKLNLYDKDGASQSYNYDIGTIKGKFSYFTGGIGFTTELEFRETKF